MTVLRHSQKRIITILILLATTILISIPLFLSYIPNGHDLDFHLLRIAGISKGLLEGQFPVRISTSFLNEYGYASGICYPDIFLYFPALLHILGLSLVNSYRVYVICCNLLTVFVSYTCFAKISKRSDENESLLEFSIPGLVGSILYSSSIWHLVDEYTRASLGEYTAMIFFPVIVLGLWELLSEDKYDEDKVHPWIILTAGCTGILQSHILSVVIVFEFVLLLIILCARRFFRKNTFVQIIKTIFATTLINLWFIVPLIDYYLKVPMNLQQSKGEIQSRGISLFQLPSIFYNAVGTGIEESDIAEMPLGIGIALLVVLLTAILMDILKVWKNDLTRKTLRIIYILAFISMFLSTKYAPYNFLMNHFPKLYQIIRCIQFSWRYNTITTLLCAVLAVIVVQDFMERRDSLAANWNSFFRLMISLLILISIIQAVFYQISFVRLQREHITAVDSSELDSFSVLEYVLVGTDTELLVDREIRALNEDGTKCTDVCISDIIENGTQISASVTNNRNENVYVEFPLLDYKGYTAKDDAGTYYLVSNGNNNLVRVTIPAGFSGMIHVQFESRWFWKFADVISFFALLGLVLILLRENHAV